MDKIVTASELTDTGRGGQFLSVTIARSRSRKRAEQSAYGDEQMRFIVAKKLYLALSFFLLAALPEVALAGPVVLNGVQYNDEAEARIAIQRTLDVMVAQVPENALEAYNVAPLGGIFAVEIPSIEETRLKYVVVSGGLFRPGRETQNLIAESVIANIKFKFLAYKKIGFIDDVIFVESGQDYETREYDYLVRFEADFNGERSPQAGQFRETNWVVRGRGGGAEYVALTAYGQPSNVNDLLAFSSLRTAVEGLAQGQSLRTDGAQVSAQDAAVGPQSREDASEREIVQSGITRVGSLDSVGAIVVADATTAAAQAVVTNDDLQGGAQSQPVSEPQGQPSSDTDEILERAISRCITIGFERGTSEFRSCVTQQIDILSM